jgi:LmbE family N-acetylglucosaminyl deacetylase
MMSSQSFTLVSFHAHPDDEALLTGGTLARATAEGHRVVLVVATAGEAGLAAEGLHGQALRDRRLAELRESAKRLGCARVEVLGYPDSGLDGNGTAGRTPFARTDVEPAAQRLARLLVEEQAHVLTIYDEAGGYGHPDHVQVHRVGLRAAALVGTPVVLEATVDQRLFRWARGLFAGWRRLANRPQPPGGRSAYTPRSQLTHRVDVRPYLNQKHGAMRAHASQQTGGSGPRPLAILLRIPPPLLRLWLGHEWFVERGRTPIGRPLDDLFATLRPGGGA